MAGEVCGAVSGAVMALGLLYGEGKSEAVPTLTENFMEEFAAQNGSVRCIDIVGFNISRAATGAEDITDVKALLSFLARGGKRVCKGAVKSAVELLLDQVEAFES